MSFGMIASELRRLPESGWHGTKSEPRNWNMTTIKILIVTICMAGLSPIAVSQSSTPPRISASDAKNHPGETVTVCGKVVDTKISKYGLAGRGKPVNVDLDQPEPHPVFFFVTFGSQAGANPEEVQAAYQGKSVCVTGKITVVASTPYIMAADRSQIKIQAEDK
jgi:hypothetical protein